MSVILSHETSRLSPVDQTALDRALDELIAGDLCAARRAKLGSFVRVCMQSLKDARADQIAQLATAQTSLAHAIDIIGTPQRPPHLERCDLADVIEQNAAIVRHVPGVAITLSAPKQICLVLAHRLALSQVIGNLFSNAVDAIVATGRATGSIAVTATANSGTLRVSIRDDGEGFAPSMAETLFEHGFSTRKHRSGGLGLHWSVQAMYAMHGALALHSAGKGHGAEAELTLLLSGGVEQAGDA